MSALRPPPAAHPHTSCSPATARERTTDERAMSPKRPLRVSQYCRFAAWARAKTVTPDPHSHAASSAEP